MVDVTDSSSTGQQVGQLLESSLFRTPDGVELSYRVLEHIAALHQVPSAFMVLQPALLGPQVFFRGRQPATPVKVGELLRRPPGIYTQPDIADHSMAAALAGACNLVLSAQAAQLGATVDPSSGLASRGITEDALTRSAAQSARHGWPFTFMLLATVGTVTAERWSAFCGALRAALRSGDEAGVVADRQILAVLGNAETDVARPFLARLRAAMDAAAIADTQFAIATARSPEDSVDPKELRRLLSERLATPGGEPAPDFGQQPVGLSGPLELELRSLDGVVSIGLTASPTPATGADLQLSVVAIDPKDTLRLEVTRVLGEHLAGATLNIMAMAEPDIHGMSRWPDDVVPGQFPTTSAAPLPDRALDASEQHHGPPANGRSAPVSGYSPTQPAEPLNGNGRSAHKSADQRITLLTVRFDPDTGTSQVDLAYGTDRSTGRATAGPLAGGAQATLAALEALGLDVPFYLVSAERATGILGEPVVVVVAPRRTDGELAEQGRRKNARIGAAEGSEPVEAASRATLAALNRFLTQSRKAPSG
jgi:hypothetical protein